MPDLVALLSTFDELPIWERVLLFLAIACVIYLLLLAAGRLLKRRSGFSLGLGYQTAALSTAMYLAARWIGPSVPLRREFAAVAIVTGVYALLPLLTRGLLPWFFETRRNMPMPKFLREVISLVVFVVAGLLVLQVDYDVQVPGLIAGSGIVAVTIGLAAQDLLGNLIAGFTLHFSRPFHVNDWLLLDGQHVQVAEINWRSTRFRTNDNVQLDVPNAHIIKQTITNFSGIERHGPQVNRPHAMRLDVGIEYSAPPNRVRDILQRAAAAVDDVIARPEPNVFVKSFGDSSIVYEIRYWIENHHRYNQVSDAVRTNVWYALRREGITIPFPIRTVQLERRRPGDDNRHGDRHEDFRSMLSSQPIFRDIEGSDLDYLLERCASHHYGRAERIIEEGAEGDSMFVITSGHAGVLISRADNTRTQVAELRSGDCFGEMSLLTGERRSATVQALTDCEVLEITKLVFSEIVERESGLLPRLSELLARRKLETEGITTRRDENAAPAQTDKENEYKATILKRLRSFFEL